jgi:Pyruvate/2-oxoacid:ferredoxin oxidoreductase delta subunit
MLVECDYDAVCAFRSYRPVVITENCIRCGTCAQYCSTRCIRKHKSGLFLPNPECCVGCGRCVEVCPAGAIHLEMIGGELLC